MRGSGVSKDDVTERIQRIGLLVGIVVFTAMAVAPSPQGLSDASWSVAALAALMMLWWITEAVPLAATALAPIVLLPLLGVSRLDEVAQSYAHPIVFLFLGGFLIAKALERWGLHRRIAMAVFRLGHRGPVEMIGSLMAATAFLSMWISNTAAAMVMVPIAQSVIQATQCSHETRRAGGDFGAALMLGIAFSATIGGMATLVGTPPNALLASYVQTAHGIEIGFGQWMLMGIPILVVLLPVTWIVLTRVTFQVTDLKQSTIDGIVDEAQRGSQRLPMGAKLTASIAALTGLALVLRPLFEKLLPGIPLSDTGMVITAALVLFATPAWGAEGGMLLAWDDAKTIRWDVLILFGGGLALAAAIDGSGLSTAIGENLSARHALPMALIVLIAMAAVVYLGELASNTAMAAVFLPIASATALGLGAAPLDLILPIGLAASLGFMLPVATPPNAIVYGTGDVTSRQMLRAGAILDIVAIVIVYILVMLIAPWIFQA